MLLKPHQLYHACNAKLLTFETTAELEHLSETIGQERALEAIKFGVGMPHAGFNLYVMGSHGLGRHTLVHEALIKQSMDAPCPLDWCYVANFQHPNNPTALGILAGTGRKLQRDMAQLIDNLIQAIPAAFRGDEYQRRAKEIQEDLSQREREMVKRLGEKAEGLGITLMQGPTGFTLAPFKEGKMLSTEQFDELPEEEQKKLNEGLETIKKQLKETMSHIPEWQREMQQRFSKLNRETMELTVTEFMAELEKEYQQDEKISAYLTHIKQDIIENVDQFRLAGESEEHNVTALDPGFTRYRVNVLVDNADTLGAPVIFEDNPTYQNLLGRIEHLARMGTLQTDFTLIKLGALHRANGGYLILDVEKVLTNPFAWDGLKRAIKSREIRIESLERQLSLISTISLEPEPIPMNLKVVLVGSRELFYLLKEYDPEFGLLFKVAADFSERFPRDDNNELLYARLIATLQKREGIRDITRDGVARIIEHNSRLAQDGDKISLHMSTLLDLLQEANYHAEQQKENRIRQKDVDAAIEAQTFRGNQYQQQLQEAIQKDIIKIETKGVQLAQVNGLSYLQLGDHTFGAPTCISATARIGGGEFIDIERETKQGGPIHSKGVLILTSYLGQRYAKNQPLSMTASLVFEQTYGQIEGDSASAAELCAILSAIGDIPIKQSLAITGSINQHGEMQAIGGVCQKIEGFFDICKARGLSGEQGVIIPLSNAKDLMLKQEIIEASAAGLFHIFAIKHAEEAMALLSGLPAGIPDEEGIYPEGTFNFLIQVKLAEWIALRLHYAGASMKEE
ncbi:Lon protease family protein [Sedimenticola selenatireducens]|uniref:endopeptidase La n=1 Tax=Sedimenticola selenatireducens TaxID=191960 RepID=A0A558DVW4_9GAMM|nr:ATP-binding protein [Sedimenticola selenatireducens]TVO77871.1 AAA family ATPase [Sedimenticola selenatireducens]TVT65176.1 MAG: AAA family ATPase [Sedimenticola selenatireducens]